MKFFLASLSNFYQKHNATLKAITTFLALFGATNYIPLPWWQSPILSWSISSQTTITITITIAIVLLSSNLFVWLKNRALKNEIESLVLRNKISELTPEEYAELTKKKLKYAARFYSHLLGLNNQSKNIKVINDGSNKNQPYTREGESQSSNLGAYPITDAE